MRDKLINDISKCISEAIINEVSSELIHKAADKQYELLDDPTWLEMHTDDEIERYEERAKKFEEYAKELEVGEYVIDNFEYLFHATPACNINSIKKYGLGGKLKRRFWDYTGSEYKDIKCGVFLATDEYVAESYLEGSEEFEEFAEQYEERYDKECEIAVFAVPVSKLNLKKLKLDTNLNSDDIDDQTYFYDGIIDYKDLIRVKLYD